MKRRVVVTGMGWVTPLGADVETVWQRLLNGHSGVGHITRFDASNFPVRIAAEVRDWNLSAVGEDPAAWEPYGDYAAFAVGAAKMAVADSGVLDAYVEPTRFGVYLGSGEGHRDFHGFTNMMMAALAGPSLDIPTFTRTGLDVFDAPPQRFQDPEVLGGRLAGMFGALGPNLNCITACAASSQALGEATELIRCGEADVMLSGGAHTMIHVFGVSGFSLLTALSSQNHDPARACRPFDRNRDGFVMGEGAAMVVLEEIEAAKARGARIYGEICGYGSTADAYRVTDAHPDGRGAVACMKMALADAGTSDGIDYINAHGTSTAVNDRVETRAVKEVFGQQAYRIPMSSTKSMMGHLIASAGATELIICLLAIRDNVLPPTINYEEPDPYCDLDYIPNVAREARCDTALTNSFGFGGQNISLIVRRV
jgi:3-oxoacyl-[acyl-carrier-protein] synthase II